MGEWSSSRFFVNMDISTEASDTTTNLTENKKARTKILFEDVRHYLKYAENPDSYFRQSGKKTSLR